MKKITDLKKKTHTTRMEKDALGRRIPVKIPIELRRKVKTIQGGPRFGHYLIDFAIIWLIGFLLAYYGIDRQLTFLQFEFRIGANYYIFSFINYIIILLYYTILEASLGRTIGKFATNSFVINEYAEKPGFEIILLRNLCRWIPFYAFSCLAERGWHDKISRTYVVSKAEWDELRRQLLEDDDFLDNQEILDA